MKGKYGKDEEDILLIPQWLWGAVETWGRGRAEIGVCMAA
jgi:hypothetical protein